MNRTIVSQSDTLTFVQWRGECWAEYLGYKFRIEKRNQWHTYMVGPNSRLLRWYSIDAWGDLDTSDGGKDYTLNFQAWSERRVIKKVMAEIRRRNAEISTSVPKWPYDC